MEKIVEWMNENIGKTLSVYQLEKHNKKAIEHNAEIFNKQTMETPQSEEPWRKTAKVFGDLSLFWNEIEGQTLRFKYMPTIWADPDELEQDAGKYQFIIIPSKNSVEESRIYRRGAMEMYAKKVAEKPTKGKMKNGRVDVSGMKTYVTMEEFQSVYTKALLSGANFSDKDFWQIWKFPRRT